MIEVLFYLYLHNLLGQVELARRATLSIFLLMIYNVGAKP